MVSPPPDKNRPKTRILQNPKKYAAMKMLSIVLPPSTHSRTCFIFIHVCSLASCLQSCAGVLTTTAKLGALQCILTRVRDRGGSTSTRHFVWITIPPLFMLFARLQPGASASLRLLHYPAVCYSTVAVTVCLRCDMVVRLWWPVERNVRRVSNPVAYCVFYSGDSYTS